MRPEGSHQYVRPSTASAVAAPVILASSLTALSSALAAQPARVGILYAQQKSYYEAVQAIEETIKRAGHTSLLFELPRSNDQEALDRVLKQLVDAKPAVVAASGSTAMSLAMKALPDVPVIFFMLPNALDAPFMVAGDGDRARVAGVTTDASPKDQLDWITKLHSGSRRVGALCSANSKRTVEAIKAAAQQRGIEIVPIEADKDQFPKAIEVLNEKQCDSVLMLPDAHVYNSDNVRYLLLWGLRQKRPVWAFSANIVKAGAFAGLFSDGKKVGEQTARLILRFLAGATAKSIGLQYSDYLGRAVNVRTAEQIRVPLDTRILEASTVRFGEDR